MLPTTIPLYPPGETVSLHGYRFIVDQETVDNVNAYLESVDSRDVIALIVDHGFGAKGGEAFGKGRIHADMETGITLQDVTFNEAGARLVEDQSYLYWSAQFGSTPVLNAEGRYTLDDEGRLLLRPECFREVSLTNFPATTNLRPLLTLAQTMSAGGRVVIDLKDTMKKQRIVVQEADTPADTDTTDASDKVSDDESKETMDKLKEQVAALELENAQLKDEIAKRDKEQEAAECTLLINALKSDGFAGEAVARLLSTQSLAQVKEFDAEARKEKPARAPHPALGAKPINQKVVSLNSTESAPVTQLTQQLRDRAATIRKGAK